MKTGSFKLCMIIISIKLYKFIRVFNEAGLFSVSQQCHKGKNDCCIFSASTGTIMLKLSVTVIIHGPNDA